MRTPLSNISWMFILLAVVLGTREGRADQRFVVVNGQQVPLLHQHWDQQGHATKDNVPGPYQVNDDPPCQHMYPPCYMHPHARERNSVYSWASKKKMKKEVEKQFSDWFRAGKVKQKPGKAGIPTMESNCMGWAAYAPYGKEPVHLEWWSSFDMLLEAEFRPLEPEEKPQPCDLLVYEEDHSAHVLEVDAQGKIVKVESKWGIYGVYEHAPECVPPEFGKPDQVYRRK